MRCLEQHTSILKHRAAAQTNIGNTTDSTNKRWQRCIQKHYLLHSLAV